MKVIRLDSSGHTEVAVARRDSVETVRSVLQSSGRHYELLLEDPPGNTPMRLSKYNDLMRASEDATIWLVPQMVGGDTLGA